MNVIIKLSKTILVCLTFLPINSYAVPDNTFKNSLGLDESIRVGHLPNGFTYYLKPTKDTEKIYFNFYVKVGNFHEHLLQYQFAHLVEHLGYSEGYPKSTLQKDLAFKNKSLSTYTSANTSNVFTKYYSSCHSNDTITIRNRLQWFYNITNMVLEDSLVKQEARCLRQEVFSRSKGMALNRKFNESVYKTAILYDKDGETPYSCWLSTYDMGGISKSSVREFYHQWYRPDRMGLIITGNIQDIEKLEQYLIELYSQIPKVKEEYDEFDLRQFYLTAPPRFKVIERKELNRFSSWNNENSKILLFFRVKEFYKTLDTKKNWINKQLYQSMFQMIYRHLNEKGVSSWLSNKDGIVDLKFPGRDYPYFRMPALINKKGTEQKNLQAVTSILQQLYTDGFTQKEWNNQKQIVLNQIDSWNVTTNKYWEDQLKNYFLYNEILPAQKKAITKQWINSLNLKDINAYLKDNFSVMPDDIYITASEGHPSLSFTEKQVRDWIKDAINNPVNPNEIVDISSLTPFGGKSPLLMKAKESRKLKEVKYRKLGIDSNTGLELLQLDNGVRVILDQKKTSNTKSNWIDIKGTSKRGASYFPKELYYTAISAPEIVEQSGAGGLSRKTILNKLGAQFPMNSQPVKLKIHENSSTVSARVKLENLENYLQLIYIYFTSPRKDSLSFMEWHGHTRTRYLDPISKVVSPMDVDMKNAIADFLKLPFLIAPTNLMSTEQFYQKQNIEFEKAMECYRAIFGRASDFKFIIKGNYKKEEVMPLVQKYLGNLPTVSQISVKSDEIILKDHTELPQGPIYHTFYATKMKTAYKLYTTPYNLSYVFKIHKDNWKDRAILNMIRTYLLPKTLYGLRYIKGKSLYTAYTEGRYSETDELYNLAIYVDALEDELVTLRTEVKRMIDELKNNGIGSEERQGILKDPLFYGRYASTPKFQEKVLRYISSLNDEDIKRIARKYLKKIYQYEFVFREGDQSTLIP